MTVKTKPSAAPVFVGRKFVLAVMVEMLKRGSVDAFGSRRPLPQREVTRQAGLGASSTICRVLKGSAPNVEGFLRLCLWMGADPMRFLEQPTKKRGGR